MAEPTCETGQCLLDLMSFTGMRYLPHVLQRMGPSYCCHMWASYSDSSRPVWSASSKSPASFVIQLNAAASPCFSVSEEVEKESLSWTLSDHLFLWPVCLLDSESYCVSLWCNVVSFECGYSAFEPPGSNTCWMATVNGSSWSLSLAEWCAVPHMATIWHANPVLRLWVTRCSFTGSEPLCESFCAQVTPCCCLTARFNTLHRPTSLSSIHICSKPPERNVSTQEEERSEDKQHVSSSSY